VVEGISSAFDEYSNTGLAYPGHLMSDNVPVDKLDNLCDEVKDYLGVHAERLASCPLSPRDWTVETSQLSYRSLPIESQMSARVTTEQR